MIAPPKEVVIYCTNEGREPFTQWFAALNDAQAQARIDARIARLRLGNLGDFKSVDEGVCELRIDYGRGYRIYFGQQGNKLIILLCAGTKQTQKVDIKQAHEYWEDYQKRFSGKQAKESE